MERIAQSPLHELDTHMFQLSEEHKHTTFLSAFTQCCHLCTLVLQHCGRLYCLPGSYLVVRYDLFAPKFHLGVFPGIFPSTEVYIQMQDASDFRG